MENSYCYSPLPPEAYSRDTGGEEGKIGIGHEMRKSEHCALWNMYWLMEPKVDEFLTGGPRSLLDAKIYKLAKDALCLEVDDTTLGELILALPVREFVNLLARRKLVDPATLLAFAARANTTRGAAGAEANVVYANFGGKAKVTGAVESAKIMPLSLVKT